MQRIGKSMKILRQERTYRCNVLNGCSVFLGNTQLISTFATASLDLVLQKMVYFSTAAYHFKIQTRRYMNLVHHIVCFALRMQNIIYNVQ